MPARLDVHRTMPPHRPHTSSNAAPTARLSIGMVTFNAADVLERALQSILQNKTPAMELVVVDGASSDGTLDILRRHADRIDQWQSEPDSGIYDAMNKVRLLATGDWLLFLGADDELLVPAEALLRHFTHPDSLYYGDVRFRNTGGVYGGRFSRYRLMQQNICHQAICYPKSIYKTKAYQTGAGMMADHRYNIELAGSGVPFVHVDELVTCFDNTGRSSVGDPTFEQTKLELIRENFGLPLYLVKRARNLAVRLLKRQRVTA
jgi:glycosyltransferase involved in cell wall biosynthesis